MPEPIRVEIPLSKTKLVKLLIFSVLFLLIGLWLAIKNPQTSNPIINSIIVKSIVAYGGIAMGVFGIYFFSKKVAASKPGVIMNGKASLKTPLFSILA